MTIRPVILCGGAGTRLWPVSRQHYPKQLLPIIGEQSLLQQTAARLSGGEFAPALVVSGEEQRFFIKRQLQDCGAAVEAILLEPAGRNTAAAAALAASWILGRGRDELLLLMPSDHVIGDRAAFLKAIRTGVPLAEKGKIITFGAEPSGPNTQYGYIEAVADQNASGGALTIACFHEKPSAETAAEYVATGRFYWNAGIFLVKASKLIDEMRRFLPHSLDLVAQAVGEATTDGLFVRPGAENFVRAENISIDQAIMERTDEGVVVPVQMEWSDVGAWDAVHKLSEKDGCNNAIIGDVVAIDTRNSLLRSDGAGVIAAVGLDNMVVIAERDAILVAPLSRVADLKPLLERLKAADRDCVDVPAKVARPWGSFETIASGPGFRVKHIILDPGARLSLQSHQHRSEHWVVVRGAAEVTVGEQIATLHQNESTYIAAGARHRLANPGEMPLELIEVQCGAYLSEDDIVRFDDEYGRAERNDP